MAALLPVVRALTGTRTGGDYLTAGQGVTDRAIVFLDYQNVYKQARTCFHDPATLVHMDGQIDPLRLALSLAEDSPFDRELTEVRVYRGCPASTRDPKGYGACMRQIATWRKHAAVDVITRELNYPAGWPTNSHPGEKPREKGIDVLLALDFVTLAASGEYDVGILFSTDTDLKPALERVADMGRPYGKPRAEVAAWSGKDMLNRRLAISTKNLWCHWLDEAVYHAVRDPTDFTEVS